jgi:hypothetical protein
MGWCCRRAVEESLQRGSDGAPFFDLLPAWPVIANNATQLRPQKVRMAMTMRAGNRPHDRWNEIQPPHFKALARSLSDLDLWSMMLAAGRSVPEAIACDYCMENTAIPANASQCQPSRLWKGTPQS